MTFITETEAPSIPVQYMQQVGGKYMADKLSQIQNLIYDIRGQKVMLDRDLSELYGVEVKRLNEAVKRNIERFPDDFIFKLTQDEWDDLRSQFATANHTYPE